MMVDIVCPVVMTASKDSSDTPYIGKCYTSVSFARPYDLKLGTIAKRLQAVQPTMFLGVPRVWEKVSEKMKAIGASITGENTAVALCFHCPSRPRHCLCLAFPLPFAAKTLPLACVSTALRGQDTAFGLCFHCPSRLRDCLCLAVLTPTTWAILEHDGPNHLVL